MRGLIASVLGRASGTYGDIAKSNFDRQQELNYQREISKMAEEKELRIDAIRRERNIGDIGGIATATVAAEQATLPDRLEMGRQEVVFETDTQGLVAGQTGRNERVRAEAAMTDSQRAEEERRALQAEQQTEAFEQTRERSQYTFDRERMIDDLRDAAATLSDNDTLKDQIVGQINLLTGAQTGSRTMSDVVAIGNGYRQMATDLFRRAEDEYDDAAKADMLKRAQEFQEEANAVFRDVRGVRLPGGGGSGSGGGSGTIPIGTIDEGFRYKGGNPNDENSWEPVD